MNYVFNCCGTQIIPHFEKNLNRIINKIVDTQINQDSQNIIEKCKCTTAPKVAEYCMFKVYDVLKV